MKRAETRHTPLSFISRAGLCLAKPKGQSSNQDGTRLGFRTGLANLGIERMPFDSTDGNCEGYARDGRIAINPLAQLPVKTLFHELAHVAIGHCSEGAVTDTELTPRS